MQSIFERGLTYTKTITMVVEHCCSCGVAFGMTSEHQDQLKRNHVNFFCPNGHSQHYTGKSDEQKIKELRSQLEEKERNLKNQIVMRHAAEEKANKLDKKLQRVHKGVCPCCNRSFENLRRHMETKHPEEFKNFVALINAKPNKSAFVIQKLTQAEKRKLKS